MTDGPPRVCVVGSLNMDLVVRTPRLPRAGETIVGESFATFPGGKGANQAVAAARAGARVAMVGCVGDDPHGHTLLDTLRADNVDVTRVRTSETLNTGIAQITVDSQGENTIVVVAGANASLTVDDVERDRVAIADADVLLMQLETPIDTVIAAAQIAKDAGATVVLNAAPALAAGAGLPLELTPCVDVLIVNEIEAAIVAGANTLGDDDRLNAMTLLGIKSVVVTLGSRGAQFMHMGIQDSQPAFRVASIDTVGAGDAFAGTFAARYAEHKIAGSVDQLAFVDAICWACAAGALATTVSGAIPSLPTRSDIKHLLTRA